MTLKEILQLCKKHILAIIFIPVVCGIISAVVCWGFLPNVYTSQKAIYVLEKKDESIYTPNQYADHYQAEIDHGILYSQQLCNDVAELVKSNKIKEAVIQDCNLESLDGFNIEIDSSEKNRVITLKVSNEDPQMATDVVESLANRTVELGKQVTEAESIKIIDETRVPESPSGPARLLITAVVVLVAFALALLLILFKDVLDTTIKNREDLMKMLKYPILTTVPKVKI